MSDALCCILGFCNIELPIECAFCNLCSQYARIEKWKTYVCTTAIDLKREFDHHFFYCDILSWRGVGDVQAPLLAVLPNQTEEIF